MNNASITYKWCHFNNHEDVHQKCKIQVSTIYPNANLCIKRCTPFIEIDDKGGEISTKILREVGFGHECGQRGSNIEEWKNVRGSKFLDKRSTQVGGSSS